MTKHATHTKTYRRLVANTTINKKTLLSTDYLNHFNELTMLVDMLPDMPEMMEEVTFWHPKTYQQHFQDSVFTHKDLACYAYDHAPLAYKIPFEKNIVMMNDLIAKSLPEFDRLVADQNIEVLREMVSAFSFKMQTYLDRVSGLINGVEQAITAVEVEQQTEASTRPVMGQDDIDTLFS